MKETVFEAELGETTYTVRVYLFPNRRQYVRHCRKIGPPAGTSIARMFGHGPDAVAGGKPDVALFFSEDNFTPWTVSHEAFHGVVYLFYREGLSPMEDSESEEAFAEHLGGLVWVILQWAGGVMADGAKGINKVKGINKESKS